MGRETVDVWTMADLATPFAVRTVATLRVADEVKDGPVALDELARRCHARADSLGRVLRFLVHRGLFVEPERDVFGPNDASRTLESDDPQRMREWLDLDGAAGRADLAFVELLNEVRGEHRAYPAAFGRTFREDLARDHRLSDSFDELMDTRSQGIAPAVARSYDWSKFTRVADVGGGKGVVLAEILREHAALRGVLIDLPGPVDLADKYLEEQGMAERVEIVVSNLSEAFPVRADACLLCDVLGDWDDEEAARILTRCTETVGADGRVLIVEALPGQPEAMAGFTEMDVRMMVYVGGRMRDLEGIRQIAELSGLAVSGTTQFDDHCIIECLPTG